MCSETKRVDLPVLTVTKKFPSFEYNVQYGLSSNLDMNDAEFGKNMLCILHLSLTLKPSN